MLLLAALLLAACGDWKVDSSALTAKTSASADGSPVAAGPDCASCHGYLLNDIDHTYHLVRTAGDADINGIITCLDCHSTSIRFRAVTLFDSVYEAPDGEKWNTLAHPNPADTTSDGIVIRSLSFLRVDTLPQHQALTMPAQASGTGPRLREYMTGLAHMNGKVDVVFDSRVSRPARFNGQAALFNPTEETCSAVACHPGDKPYRWAAGSKGLPELKGE